MAKAITHAVESRREKTFAMDKDVLRMACDDGTTYVAERQAGGRRWTVVRRIDSDGTATVVNGRLPACVEAHMDGRTLSGPYGIDGREYWEK
jgi:hypothetical protein